MAIVVLALLGVLGIAVLIGARAARGKAPDGDLAVRMPALVASGRRAPAGPAEPAQPESPLDLEAFQSYLMAKARTSLGIDLSQDPLARQRLAEAAAQTLAELRFRPKSSIHLPFLSADASGPKHLDLELHRDEVDVVLGRRYR